MKSAVPDKKKYIFQHNRGKIADELVKLSNAEFDIFQYNVEPVVHHFTLVNIPHTLGVGAKYCSPVKHQNVSNHVLYPFKL